MFVELFPFSHVQQGSRVLLYGFGNVGRQYLLQLEATGYAKVVGIIDKRASNLRELSCLSKRELQILEPENIVNIPGKSYDYLVVAISDKNVADRIRDFLIESLVKREKIVSALQPSYLCDSDMNKMLWLEVPDSGIIQSPEIWAKFLNDMMFVHGNPWLYRDYIEKAINEAAKEKETLLSLFKGQLSLLLKHKGRLIILNMMYKKQCFDADCMRLFIETIKELDWDDETPYFCIIGSDIMILNSPECLYPEYYETRKRLLKRICEYYRLSLPKKKEMSNNRTAKVLFAFNHFHDKSPVCKIAANYMNGFKRRGCDVKAVVLGFMDEVVEKKLFLVPFACAGHYVGFDRDWEACMGKIPVSYIDEWDLRKRLQKGIDEICAFDPDVIIDFTDEAFPTASILIERYPVVHMPARGLGTSAFFDFYVAVDSNSILNKGIVPIDKIRQATLYNFYSEDVSVNYKRSSIGLSKRDFVIITVGSRLQRELQRDFLDMVYRLLDDEADIKWLVVHGEEELSIDCADFVRLQNEKKIILRGYEKHLDSLYKLCDAYLEPNRQGGAVSIRRAMMMGLPIAMTDFPSDNLARMKGHVVHGGYDELAVYIKKLIHDRKYCLSEGKTMKCLIKDASPQADADKVLEICREAIEARRKDRRVKTGALING